MNALNDIPYLYLGIIHGADGCSLIQGDRDALVTLRSAIDEALHLGRGTADLADGDSDDFQVIVLRAGA